MSCGPPAVGGLYVKGPIPLLFRVCFFFIRFHLQLQLQLPKTVILETGEKKRSTKTCEIDESEGADCGPYLFFAISIPYTLFLNQARPQDPTEVNDEGGSKAKSEPGKLPRRP